MLIKTDAIVLRTVKYGEKRAIVDLFTREQGRLSFIVSLPQTSRGRMKKQYFQPLTLLSTECDVRPTAELHRLREVSLRSPLGHLHSDAVKLSIALFLSEFLYHALKGEQQNAPLFDYVAKGVEWLDGCTGRFANFHLVFIMRLSRFLGFWPNTEGSAAQDCCFDLRSATFTAAVPPHADYLDRTEAAHLHLLMRMDFATMHLFRLSREQRGRVLDVMLRYYRLHVPDFPELRSPEVLHELFA